MPESSSTSIVNFGNSIEILSDKPLPELNSDGGKAYMARILGQKSAEMYTIVATEYILPRMGIVGHLASLSHPSLPNLCDHQIIDWPLSNARRPAFTFTLPKNTRRLWQTLNGQHHPLLDNNIILAFIRDLVSAIRDLHSVGITHGSIRPTTIFWNPSDATTPPHLHDFVSFPPGVAQPIVFETIERGMCSPAGKGAGTTADDCYAIGVTLAMMMTGKNICQGRNDSEILSAKIENGSFITLMSGVELPRSYMDILRGLLTDDVQQRWTIDDIEHWLSGRNGRSQIVDTKRRAISAISFARKEFLHPRPLAMAMLANTLGGGRVLANSNIVEEWIKRSFGDAERAKLISDFTESSKAQNSSGDRNTDIVAYTSIILDPAAPIRYQNIAFFPSSIEFFLAEAMAGKLPLQHVVRMLRNGLLQIWSTLQRDDHSHQVEYVRQILSLNKLLDDKSLGSGVENMVYVISPELPCLSPLVLSRYVTRTEGLLPALDESLKSGHSPTDPIDRHIAAFLSVRDKRSGKLIEAINSTVDRSKRNLMTLALYADIQKQYGHDSLPNLAEWLHKLVEPILLDYLSRLTRENKKREMKRLAAKGDLSGMLKVIQNDDDTRRDELGFNEARKLCRELRRDISSIERDLSDNELMNKTGRPVAAVIAGIIAIAAILLTLLKFFIQDIYTTSI